MGRNTMTLDEARERDLADIPLAASTSFRDYEVAAMVELFATLRRGGDTRVLMRSSAIANVQRKFANATATIARQHERRAAKAAR